MRHTLALLQSTPSGFAGGCLTGDPAVQDKMGAHKRTAWLMLATLTGLAIFTAPLASSQNFTDDLGIVTQITGYLPASRNEVQGDLQATQGQEDAKLALLENSVKVLTAKINSLTPVSTPAALPMHGWSVSTT